MLGGWHPVSPGADGSFGSELEEIAKWAVKSTGGEGVIFEKLLAAESQVVAG
jgi:hypothetical protein